IAEIFDKYNYLNGDASVAKEEDVICEYIKGYKLIGNVPWQTVEYVLTPINVRDMEIWNNIYGTLCYAKQYAEPISDNEAPI
ncbi:hypothetical protein HAX54_031753, partial [Datura stramonium]|nr:hypothetical protein [Datura stramonium]